ncbi:hypothetical protein IKE71_03815 [Candidatus Saccharibacteria bacterium]|nr:hypothetical protein [Candidatus Saccharibacteria bacterium]
MNKILWHITPPVSMTTASTDATSYSDLNLNGQGKKFISLERNYTLLDGSFEASTEDVPFWSSAIGNGNYIVYPNFNPAPSLTVTFDSPQTQGLTFLFDTATGDYLYSFYVVYYDGATLLESKSYFCTNAIFYADYSGAAYDNIEIIVNNSLPLRRAKIDGIVVGEIKTFTGNDIESETLVKECDLDAESLPYGTATLRVTSSTDISPYFAARQRIDVWHDDVLLGVYFLDTVSRISEKRWQINAVDGIGILQDMDFAGGDYTGVGASAYSIISTLVSGSGLSVVYDNIADATCIGILKTQSRRNALQQVLFRLGASARMEGLDLHLFAAPTSPSGTKSKDKVYMGATIDTDTPKSAVVYNVDDYYQAADGMVVIGNTRYAYSTTTLTSNYVTAGNAAQVTINGTTLVTLVDATAILARAYAFYARRNRWKGRFVWDGEKLGDRLTLPTSWTTLTGNIYKMTLTISGIVAAEVEALE